MFECILWLVVIIVLAIFGGGIVGLIIGIMKLFKRHE
jgi:ABC-type uncharacterized transport system permease subunit